MSDLAIQTQGLAKTFRSRRGSVLAVDDLNLTVHTGEIFGLLGPNGAGKTTTIRMLCGLIRPSAGQAFVDGLAVTDRPDDVRARIGLVPEDAGDHGNLSLIEELEYHGALHSLRRATVRQRAMPLIERLGLGDRASHRLETFSKGMRRKFHLIRALLHQPRILLLDEPTAGLDPAIVEDVWDLFKALAQQHQVTVILCSHHLEEVEKLCDRVAIVRQRLLAQGTVAELSGGEGRWRIALANDAAPFLPLIARLPGVHEAAAQGTLLRFSLTSEARDTVPPVVRAIVENGGAVLEVAPDTRDLRTLYKSVVGDAQQPGGPQ